MDGGGDPMKMSREQYAELFGPTTGDKVRLGDTDLWIEVEKDFTNYGEEMIFGGGKTIRDGMGQNGRITGKDGALDLVITNAVILDYTGIVKADIGVKDGRIVGVGKSGNPDMMDGVDPHMIIGAGTEVISGEGKIVTAGGVDTHIHFICPQQMEVALSSGVTTLLGGGTGPATEVSDDLYIRCMVHVENAGSGRGVSDQCRFLRKRKCIR